MAVDPRSLAQKRCALIWPDPREAREASFNQQAKRAQSQGFGPVFDQLNSSFDAAGLLSGAGLDTLSAIPGVQSGLESLTRLSDEIRGVGAGLSRTTPIGNIVNRVISEGGSIESGANAILQGLGIGPNITALTNNLSSSNIADAFATACSVFEKVRSGDFSLSDAQDALLPFTNLAKDIGTAPVPSPDSIGKFQDCAASPYATDLIRRAPKFKYQYVVEFEWSSPYTEGAGIFHAFVVKNTTRPNIRYDYEDVNMYNFRTKAIKRMEYEPMTMRFLDDDENESIQFFNTYYKAMSPIGNLPEGSDTGKKDTVFNAGATASTLFQEQGMNFKGVTSNGINPMIKQDYSSSIGPLRGKGPGSNNDTRSALKRITIYHVYDQGRQLNVYSMFNPKITELTLDELDHSIGTEGTEVAITFTYDALNVVDGASFDPNGPQEFQVEALEVGAGASYPLRYVDHPNNPPVQDRGLTGAAAATAASFAGADSPLGALQASAPQLVGQTLDRLTNALPLQLPGAGDLAAATERLSEGLSSSIPNLSNVATSTFLNAQFIARTQTQLGELTSAVSSGALDFRIDGANLPIAQATQVLNGRLAKGIQLAQNGSIDALSVALIDRAAGVQQQVSAQVQSILDQLQNP